MWKRVAPHSALCSGATADTYVTAKPLTKGQFSTSHAHLPFSLSSEACCAMHRHFFSTCQFSSDNFHTLQSKDSAVGAQCSGFRTLLLVSPYSIALEGEENPLQSDWPLICDCAHTFTHSCLYMYVRMYIQNIFRIVA